MAASAPSRHEVEHLHRLMMQASADAAQLDRRLADEEKADSLSAELRHWHEVADAVLGALERGRAALLRDGTPKDQLDRILERLEDLKGRSRRFDIENDFDGCVQHWKSLGLEFAQLSGRHRDPLVRLLEGMRARVDQTTSVLSSARRTGGMLPQKHAKVRGLQDQRDKAREKYLRLRQKYLEAERDHQQAERQKAQAEQVQEHRQHKAPLPDVSSSGAARRGPLLVRLPDPQAAGKAPPGTHARSAAGRNPTLPPPAKAVLSRPSRTNALHPAERKKHAARTPDPTGQAVRAAPKAKGPARISLERIERAAGYPTGLDGIGRGGQSAALFFRADNLPDSLSIQGATSIQLGCATRLDVMPSVQLFSAAAGAPLKGKLSLLLLSTGGRLGTTSPKSALDAAKSAARAAGKQVAGKLGVIGKQLESAIGDLLVDAADKIFRRAQARAPQGRLPHRLSGGSPKGGAAEHHLARLDHALGGILQSPRGASGAGVQTQRLLQHLDRDHQHRDSVAARLEQTLSQLATASHRTLTDPSGGELRGHLARMDAILSRLRGKAGDALASGAREISEILQRMGSIAAGRGGAAHLGEFRKLIDERRGQLEKLSRESRRKTGAEALHRKGALPQMPSAQVLGEKQLAALRKQHPGIDKLLKNASHSQLASELGALSKGALGSLLGKKAQRPGGLFAGSLAGAFQALGGSHLGGFGGGHRAGALGSLSGAGGGLGKVLEKQLQHQLARSRPQEAGKLLATLHKAPRGTALHELARTAEARQKQLATRRAGRRGPAASQITAAALLEVFQEHPKGRTFASHLAPGGSLRSLCETAQRGHGLPVGRLAQHFLASRGHSQVFNAVATFNHLVEGGHKPHRWALGSIGHFVSSQVSSALGSVSRTAGEAASAARGFAGAAEQTVRGGMSSFGNIGTRLGAEARDEMRGLIQRGAGAARNPGGAGALIAGRLQAASGSIFRRAHGLWNSARKSGLNAWGSMSGLAQGAFGNIRTRGHALSNLARGGFAALHDAPAWVQHKAGAALDWARHRAKGSVDWARQRASGASHWLNDKVHSGLEWAKKTGVAGGIGKGLTKGMSFMKKAAEYTPLGLAVKAGKWAGGGGLAKVWAQTKGVAGKAWGGLKSAYKTTSNFLQSPAGQLLVTGLSLAASFIPGGLVVKAIIGGGIGAIQAISEGKDWKGVLAGAAGGALTGALPFLKLGPLAKMGVGALTSGITALAQGGSLKDALKGAAGGAIDSFDPGAFKALSRLKGVTAAEKLLRGKNLSKAEKALLEGSKFAGPLRGLEKAMANPRTARMVGGLEKAGSKAVKGGIWVSGKAAKVQGVLDKVVGAGDQVHGVLSQVHDLAPGLAQALGDNAAGHWVASIGDLAGRGDEKLATALEYGHGAEDRLSRYRGYLDKGLGFAGVKDPQKAYQKRVARQDLAAGKKGGLERVAGQKLDDHQRKHPELHLAEAFGKRTRGPRAEFSSPRRRAEPPGGNAPKSRLELALAKGRGLIQRGERVARGVHDGLGKIEGGVEKGLQGARTVQGALEKASELAEAGAGILGEESELGRYLLEVSGKASQVHGYLEQGIGLAQEFDKGVRKAHELTGKIPGVHDEEASTSQGKKARHRRHEDGASPLQNATHLAGGKATRGAGGRDGSQEHWQGHEASPHHAKTPGSTKDARLRKLEHALGKGIRIGRKVDGGLARIAGVAGQLGKALGEDSELGHFSQQVSAAAGAGHGKLHEALNVAGRGKRGLHKGRELFEKGLQLAAGHHAQKLEKVHGKERANAGHEHGGGAPGELLRHAGAGHLLEGGRKLVHGGEHAFHDAEKMWTDGSKFVKDGKRSVHDVHRGVNDLKHGARDAESLWGHLKAHDWKAALGDGKHLLEGGKHLLRDGKHIYRDGKKLLSEGKELWGEGQLLLHGEDGREPAHGPRGGVAGGFSEAEVAQVVQGARQWVASFGKAVTAAIRDIEKLISSGQTKEAGDRVQAVSVTSEQTRFEVTRAVSSSAKFPALHREAQSASKHYLEIRKHFFTFVKGLHGLGGQTSQLEGLDGNRHPDLLALSTDLNDLRVKVDALGDLKHSDTSMQGPVADLQKQAAGLRARVAQTRSAHRSDAAALEAIAGLSEKLQQLERQLGAHADRKSRARGDQELGISRGARPAKRPAKKTNRRGHHGKDLIGEILDGEHGRIRVDRGGARGDIGIYDGQEVDPAAADTWIGSGEGVKLFSEVFGAFLPAQGALVQSGRGGEVRARGGGIVGRAHGADLGGPHPASGALHGQLGAEGLDLGGKPFAGGFFKELFDHLHGFADKIGGWAKAGGKMLGQAMHFAELGMHGLSAIERAAGTVEGFAAKAEGILGKMGLTRLAGLAGKIGGAAGWVDKESKLLHGGLRTADQWMGKGKKVAGQVAGAAAPAGGIFDDAEHGRFGSLLNLFKASKNGDGTDGKLLPEKVRLGSQFDEPRRLDVMTLSRMEGFLGGDFAGVRVHTGPGAAEVTARFAAEAVTVKDHIFFAPGRFNPSTTEGQRLLAHELTHVMQKGRKNLDVRTAESEALRAEHSFGYSHPRMETLNLSRPSPDFRLGDGEGLGTASGVHTAKRNRSRGHEAGGRDTLPDGDEFLEQVSNRVYDLLMDELEHSFESR